LAVTDLICHSDSRLEVDRRFDGGGAAGQTEQIVSGDATADDPRAADA
jgi:hypothetical protein